MSKKWKQAKNYVQKVCILVSIANIKSKYTYEVTIPITNKYGKLKV